MTRKPPTFEDNRVEDLPPPPEEVATDLSAAPVFVPYTVAPRIRRIDQSSGHPTLDEAAMKVSAVYEFSPAQNRAKNVSVWVAFSIVFQVR